MKKALIILLFFLLPSVCKAADKMEIRRGTGTIYHLSLKEGEKNLLLLARRAKVEDAWVFLPTQKKWVDIGDYQWEGGTTMLLPTQKILAGEDVVIFYHLHPAVGEDRGFRLPSLNDLLLSGVLEEKISSKVICRVVDSVGVWTYRLTPKGKEMVEERMPFLSFISIPFIFDSVWEKKWRGWISVIWKGMAKGKFSFVFLEAEFRFRLID